MIMDINSAWDELQKKVEACRKCGLCQTRRNTVFGEGPVDSKCVIIGEAPGMDEDEKGKPFIGRAGQLLTDILEKGGHIARKSVYIMNVVKCHPPGTDKPNRPPSDEEKLACNDFLEAQLLLIQPQIIVTMGNTPTQWLLKTAQGITKLRGKWVKWRGLDLLPMYHPSYLLRQIDTSAKLKTWDDVKSLKAKLDSLR